MPRTRCKRRGCGYERSRVADQIASLEGWLTTVVARICLNMLRDQPHTRRGTTRRLTCQSRSCRAGADRDPEQEALLADAVGIALQVVLAALARRNGSRSCYTTCSRCRSTRSRADRALPRRPGNSPAGPGGG